MENEQKSKLADRYMRKFMLRHGAIRIYLKTGVKLEGSLIEFDDEVVVIDGSNSGNAQQVVFRSAISTIQA